MMMSVVSLAFVGVLWALVGYSLAFVPGGAAVGDLSLALLRGVGLTPAASSSIPQLRFFAYQGTFAIVTAALISGAVVERIRFVPYGAFIALWSLLVYAPVAHWMWGGGWLAHRGALDFAGGTVVHVNAARSAPSRDSSSPRRGEMWKAYQRHYGKDGDVFVWKANTGTMNPTVPASVISAAYAEDEAAANAEYGGDFRRDIETFLTAETPEASRVPGRRELGPTPGCTYLAFVDPSGGVAGPDAYSGNQGPGMGGPTTTG
jgi:hypothetical protein